MKFSSLLFISLKLRTCMPFRTLATCSVKTCLLLLALNLPPVRFHSWSILLLFAEVMSNESQTTFIRFSWFHKALPYFCPAESFPGTRALASCLLHVWQLVHMLSLLLPLSVPLPTTSYTFFNMGTHLHIGYKMQHWFTLWQSSMLFLIFVPYLITLFFFFLLLQLLPSSELMFS